MIPNLHFPAKWQASSTGSILSRKKAMITWQFFEGDSAVELWYSLQKYYIVIVIISIC